MNLQNRMVKVAQKIDTLTKKMSEMENAKVPTDAYKEVQAHINSTTQKLSVLNDRMEKYIELGKSTKSNAFKSMQYDAAELSNTLLYLHGEMQDLIDSGEAFTNLTGTDSYRKASIELQNAQAQMAQLRSKAQGVIDKEMMINQEADKMPSKFKKVVQNVGKIGTSLKSALIKLKKLTTETNRSNKGASNLARTFKQMVLSMAVFQIMFKGIEFLKSGLQNLALYSKEYNKVMSEFISSTSQLKNSFAAAFQPILNTVIPILSRFIDYLSSAANAVSRFFAILQGKTTYTKAIKQNKNYAESLNNLGKSADKAKNSLAAFDDLDVLQNNDSSSAGSSGSSDAPDGSGFVNESVGEVSKWMQAIKDAINGDDWYSVGALIAEKLNEAMESIEWGFVREQAKKYAKYLAEGLNGFVDEFDWYLLGSTIGNGLNTALDFGYTFLTTYDFKKFGTSLGDSINGFFSTVDWKEAGETVGYAFKGIFDSLSGFLEEVDWDQIGEDVKTFLVNIDWDGVADSVFEAIGAGFGGLASFIGGLFGEGIDNAQGYFQENIDACGGSFVSGILLGIAKAVKGIDDWISEHVLAPFLDGFMSAFGIEGDSSTVMGDHGEDIMCGLMGGMLKHVTDVDGIWKSLRERAAISMGELAVDISEKISSVKQDWSDKWDDIKKKAVDRLLDVKTDTTKSMESIRTKIAGTLSSTKSNWNTNFDDFLSKANSTWTKVKTDTSNSMENMKTRIFSALSNISSNWSSSWSGMGKETEKIFRDMWSNIKGSINFIIGGVESMANGVITGLNNVIDALNNFKISLSWKMTSKKPYKTA